MRAVATDNHVCVATDIPFFHVAGGYVQILEDLFQFRHISVGFVRTADVRLADDLNKGRAGPIQVHVGIPVGILESIMDALAGIVFHVDARNADALVRAIEGDVNPAMLRQRLVILGDLITLGQIGIKIILARKARHRA